MWVVVILIAVALGFAAVQWGIVPPPGPAILIRIRAGRAEVVRGRLRADVLASVSRILEEKAVQRGFIALTTRDRVRFSFRIPAGIHQRLRNVLLNRW